MRNLKFFLAFILFLGVTSFGQPEQVRLATYGPSALIKEGDDNSFQVIYFRFKELTTDSIFVRVFDPDCGGSNDEKVGDWNTTTKFTFYGGKNSLQSVTNPLAERDSVKGTLLSQFEYGVDGQTDNEWVTLGRFAVSENDKSDGYYTYKLLIEGKSGDDGNIFDVFISGSSRKNLPVRGAEVFSYSPTLRFDKLPSQAVVRFFNPQGNKQIEIATFDLASAPIALETPVRTKLPITASLEGKWASTNIELNRFEEDRVLGLLIGNGKEVPNSATFFVKSSNGLLLPVYLPVTELKENSKPKITTNWYALADCRSIVFDAKGTTDAEKDRLEYLWHLGDGSKATGIRVVHEYLRPGEYKCAVEVSDNSGAVGNTSVYEFSVIVNKAPTANAGSEKTVAFGDEVLFDGSRSNDPDGSIIRYYWEFGDNSTGEGRTVVHKYARPGRYRILLRVTDNSNSPCNENETYTNVWVNEQPIADAGKVKNVSPGESAEFDGSGSIDKDGKLVRYIWEFGDGNKGEGVTVNHVYKNPGLYTSRLTVYDDANVGNSYSIDSTIVLVNFRPVANAGKDQIVAEGETVYFDALESTDRDGEIISYLWNFDGLEKKGVSVSHVYEKAGIYSVLLQVKDNSNTSTDTDLDTVVIRVNARPKVIAGQDKVITSSELKLDGTGSQDSDGKITRYEWDFGDGRKSDSASTTHVFKEPGVYEVTLRVKDDTETENSSNETTIQVIVNQKPVADAGPDMIAAPNQELFFSGERSFDEDGAIAEYRWDFSDGFSSTQEKVSHSFSNSGVYTARLTVKDNTLQDNAVDFDELIVVVNQSPVAKAGKDIVVAPGDEIFLDGRSSFDLDGKIEQYSWEIIPSGIRGDSAQLRFSLSQPGIYKAVLSVKDNSGALNGYHFDTLLIRVNSMPVADAGTYPFTCETKIFFDAGKSTDADGDPLKYYWNFGEGNKEVVGQQVFFDFKKGGKYPVLLTVDDGLNLKNSKNTTAITIVINEPPIADAGRDEVVCAGEIVRFNAAESKDPEGGVLRYLWDFGDSTFAEGINPTKIYKIGGTYQVRLRVEDDSGLPCNYDYDTKIITVSESPVANAGPDITVCANSVVKFDGSNSRDYDGVVNNYRWDFGDGELGGGVAPTHSYARAGVYKVELTITGDVKGECDDTDTDEMIVTVIDAPQITFSSPALHPVNTELKLSGVPTVAPGVTVKEYLWDFGDNSTATGQSVTKTYTKYGNYYITLRIRTSAETECSDASITKLIVINEPPYADPGEDRVAGLGELVNFSAAASKDLDGSIEKYIWNYGDGSPEDTGIVVRHEFKRSGEYLVRLTVKDNTSLPNNTSSKTIKVFVNPDPTPRMKYSPVACQGKEISFTASGAGTNTNPDAYFWSFGDGNTAYGANVTHSYAAPGKYLVTLVVNDGKNLSNSKAEITDQIIINNPPVAVSEHQIVTCAGEPITLSAKGSYDYDNDKLEYLWKLPDGSTLRGETVTTKLSSPGQYTILLIVDDGQNSGCSKSELPIKVLVNNPPVAFAGGDKTGFTGGAHDEILFDATGSSDPDNDNLTYAWDFGDGTTAVGSKVYHLYQKPGTYTVKLTVSDGRGTKCSSAIHFINIIIRSRQ